MLIEGGEKNAESCKNKFCKAHIYFLLNAPVLIIFAQYLQSWEEQEETYRRYPIGTTLVSRSGLKEGSRKDCLYTRHFSRRGVCSRFKPFYSGRLGDRNNRLPHITNSKASVKHVASIVEDTVAVRFSLGIKERLELALS